MMKPNKTRCSHISAPHGRPIIVPALMLALAAG